MATWDSAYLLTMFNRYAGRPASGDSISDADKYIRLNEGQNRVIAEMSFRCPDSLNPKGATLNTMTASANGNIWTFGTDPNGYAIAPFGKARIFDSPASFPQYAWVEGWDYVNEGTQIRLTNNRTWSGALYWYGITLPADITAAGLAAALQAAAPAGVALPPLRVAVNQEFVDGRLDLRDGDEVAVIPPVAGG